MPRRTAHRQFAAVIRLCSSAATMALVISTSGRAQTSADTAQIRAAAMNYIQGWYEGDAERMASALHPELAKRMVRTDSAGRSQLLQMSAMSLIEGTRRGGGTKTPLPDRRDDVRVLDIYRGAAVAKVVASNWIDYLELVRWNGEWKIINVLWELTPKGERPVL